MMKSSKHCSTVPSQKTGSTSETIEREKNQCDVCYEGEKRRSTASNHNGRIYESAKRREVQVTGNYTQLERQERLGNRNQNSYSDQNFQRFEISLEKKKLMFYCA